MEQANTQSIEAPQPKSPNNGWLAFGWLLWLLALAAIGLSVQMDTSISVSETAVNNLGLMQRQMMLFQSGLVLSVMGLLSMGVGAIRNAIVERANP